jgi:hypothetical protein
MAARRNRYTSFCAFIHLSAALRSSRLQDFGTQIPANKGGDSGFDRGRRLRGRPR